MHLVLLALAVTATPRDIAPVGEPALAHASPTVAAVSARAPGASPVAPDRPATHEAPPRARLLGAELHAGFPDGFALSAVVRPVPWARASAGLAHNVLGLGIQGGLTLLPFRRAVTPTLHLAIGRFFETDVSDDFSGTFPDAFDPSLRKFGYTFYSAQLGLELGSQQRFVGFLRAGVAWLRSGLDGVQGYQDPGSPNTTVNVSDVDLSATTPTVNLGVVWYLW